MFNIQELELAIEYLSDPGIAGLEAFLDTSTGAVIIPNELGEFEPPVNPSDARYLSIPTKQDLRLGKSIAVAFTREHMANEVDTVFEIFRKRGAFSRFKGLVDSHDLLETWYEYQERRTREAIEQWLKEEGFSVDA